MEQEQVVTFFSEGIRHVLQAACLNFGNIYEIRLRVSQPLLLSSQEGEIFLDDKGRRTRDLKRAFRVTAEELSETLEIISEYSLYAYEEELRQGFLTVPGGHRVGVAGRTVLFGKRVDGMRDISCLNLRLAHEKKGCADSVFSWVYGKEVAHTLIISPPRCGKTTLLRDLIRQISNGTSSCPGRTVGVVDERSEIAGCYQGIAQNDVGIRTDVLDGCPKAEGMMMLIRSMAPQVVAVDELGDYEDIHAIESVVHCGCKLLATVHGNSLEDLRRKPLFQRLMEERVFERYLLLGYEKRAGVIRGIYDADGQPL
ncbi:putative uncharacterized protein [Blautia hydrogenotrophica CAG:147]|uniref:stage III sporulation protein AA n=1 Tax=Blautia hydrogenotrophica TaxID=53443 RepID=UPI00033765A4|nr:stage III sporulation protein AA [Blautia hydrogenotrophica]CCX58992.1 putative uncharacterized protein [Blautia hydrogenotrophica CAG:147]